jgi:ATP-dependent exoDNAse (exonuclease V) beta subunit
MAVTAIGAEGASSTGLARDAGGHDGDRAAGVILGRVVHRMFQRGVCGDADEAVRAAAARRLVNDDELAAIADTDAFTSRAAAVFAGMWAKRDVRAALDGAECFYEVPVSLTQREAESPAGRPAVLRGVIDCLVRRPDGRVIVLDFKTGKNRRTDRRQLDAYVQAARQLFPGAPVEGLLVYAD